MRTVHADVHKRGGIAATFELLRDGHTSYRLALAVRRGDVVRVRQGHYGCPELAEPQLEAYRVGGRLTGLAGLRAHQVWTPGSGIVDVQVRPDARALRTRTNPKQRLAEHPDSTARVTWTDRRRPGTRSLAGPEDCVRIALGVCDTRTSFAIVESALRGGVLTRAEWRRLLVELPPPRRRLFAGAGGTSESGGESLLRFDLRATGLAAQQQMKIAGVGRVDFLLGRLIVEVDGYEFHSDRSDFEEDRRRDAVASTLGYRTLRFSHLQVERNDPVVMAAIRAAIARGDHL